MPVHSVPLLSAPAPDFSHPLQQLSLCKVGAKNSPDSVGTASSYASDSETKIAVKLPDQQLHDCLLRPPPDAQVLTAPRLHETNRSANAWFYHSNFLEIEADFVRNVTCG